MTPGLLSVLLLLAGAVLAVVAVRTLRLPALFGYVLVGVVLGPNALGWVRESTQTETLAEFGIVFLMFTLGLEFSLPRLRAMRGLVFGVGGLQVLLTSSMVLLAGLAFGLDWRSGLVLGGTASLALCDNPTDSLNLLSPPWSHPSFQCVNFSLPVQRLMPQIASLTPRSGPIS
jgi:CPA2 family monovalent cation:H+ antiporter-2